MLILRPDDLVTGQQAVGRGGLETSLPLAPQGGLRPGRAVG
jgi:hypothetical protein